MATGLSRTKWNGHGERAPSGSSCGRSAEAYLSYEGKCSEGMILATNPGAIKLLQRWVRPDDGEWENRFYYGDNLPVLASFLRDPLVKGRVRLVYIDPPFATRSVFQSRSQVDAYQDLLSGASYIEFIRQRLVLLRELLADDGSIYVHLDDNMAFYVKVIMDEVFGRANFRNWITRKKCNPKNYTRKTYGNVSDFIGFYTKSDSYVWNRPIEGWTAERTEKEYQYVEKGTGRRYKKVPVHAPGTRNGETGKPWRGVNPPPGKHWQFTPRTLDEMDSRGEIYWSPTGNPRRKVYLNESDGVPVQDIWLDVRDAHNQNIRITGYPTEKNPDMLSRVICASSNPGDLVLDCFSGSGTTLAVAARLGRRWIGVDNSSEAIAATLRQFAQGSERMGDFVSHGRGGQDAPHLQTLPLFNLAADQGPSESTPLKSVVVGNFSVYASEPYSGELDQVISEWSEWF